MPTKIIAAGALLACLAACGGSGGNGGNGNNPSLSISPGSTTVTSGGTAVTFTATLSNATGTVSWALTGPGSITPSTGNTTSYTPPANVASATTATLTATSGSLSSNATITINPPAAITVAGMVVDGDFNKFKGVTVIIGGQSTVTDASGHFSIANVTPPYDLTAVAITNYEKGASLYKGLTRADPTILVYPGGPISTNSGDLTGTVTGGDPLGTAGEDTVVAWVSPQAFGSVDPSASDEITSSPYTLGVSWDAALPSITGNMHVLQWVKDGSGLPSSYKGYAVKTGVSVSAGGTTSNVNLPMSAPGTANVGGTVTAPAGVTISGKDPNVVFDDTAEFNLGFDPSAATSFSYLYPNVSGATASISVDGQNAGGDTVYTGVSAIALGTTSVGVSLPPPISALLPADSATGIGTSADFTWTASSGGNAVYVFQAFGPPGQPTYLVFTTATSARIPDLSAQGLVLPAGASYTWSVRAVGPHASIDSAAGAKTFFPTGNLDVEARTKDRTFTTPAITVTGTVVDYGEEKLAGVTVMIGGQSTVTDASGRFSVANVTPPYDLTALVTTGSKGASLYKGLTRADPTILVPLDPVSASTGTLTGTVTGGDPLGTAGESTVGAWSSAQAGHAWNASLPLSSSPYTMNVSWEAALTSISGNMHVLQWARNGSGLPSSYKGYAVKMGVSVSAGGTTSNVNLAMSAPGTANVGGTITAPAGVTIQAKGPSVTFDDAAAISLGFDQSAATSFSYLYPNVSGATASIVVNGQNAGGEFVLTQMSAIALGTTNVGVTLPANISALSPADGATGIGTSADFTWTAFSGGNAVYIFRAVGPSGQPTYAVVTTATSARIPDLSAHGLGLPASASYTWNVVAQGPHASLDSAAGPNLLSPPGNLTQGAFTKISGFTTP